jgi:antiphage defense system Thoeris ThsB-like protein
MTLIDAGRTNQLLKKRVFLSFLAEDKQRVTGLRLLAANPDYELDFYDESIREAIDSQNSAYIKQQIRARINRTTVTVCLISENTHTSRWVDWELDESNGKGNSIVAMALKGVERAILPSLIRKQGLTFYPWDPGNLADLLSRA